MYYYRSSNGLQNFAGYLEYFDMGNSSANSSCTETSHLKEDDRIALVRCSTLMVVILILSLQGAIISIINLGGAIGSLLAGSKFNTTIIQL